MINFNPKDRYGFEDLVEIMAILRSPEGCPWDREQTHESIRNNFLEEVYEAVDAIDHKDTANLREELGDVMMQVVFHAQIAREEGLFGLEDVLDEVCQKLIRRHPHIFGTVSANTSQEVLKNWDAIKRQEKGQNSVSDTLRQVPTALPALMYAQKLQSRARKGGLSLASIQSPMEEMEQAMQQLGKGEQTEQALGRLLFAAALQAGEQGLSAEEALTYEARRFVEKFEELENIAPAPLSQLSSQEQARLWQETGSTVCKTDQQAEA